HRHAVLRQARRVERRDVWRRVVVGVREGPPGRIDDERQQTGSGGGRGQPPAVGPQVRGRDRGARTRSYAAAAGMGFGGGRFRTSGHVSAPVGVDESRRAGDRTAVVAVVAVAGSGTGGRRAPVRGGARGGGLGGGRFRTGGHVPAPVGVDGSRRSGDRTAVVAVVAVVGSGTGGRRAAGPAGARVRGRAGRGRRVPRRRCRSTARGRTACR